MRIWRRSCKTTLDTYESTHDYDEYHFDLDGLNTILCAHLHPLCASRGGMDACPVQGTLEMLFDRQYILTEDVVVEVRYRTETRTDSEGNDYEVEVPYNWYICYVTLENKNLSISPWSLWARRSWPGMPLYMSSLGNRPDLFPESGYVDKYTKPPADYDVPRNIWTMKPLRLSWARRKSTWVIPMCGAAAPPPLPLTAPASYPG